MKRPTHILALLIIVAVIECPAQNLDSLKQAILDIDPEYKTELQSYRHEQTAGKVFQVIGILGMSFAAATYARQFSGESLPTRLLLSSSGVLLIGTAIRIQSGVKLNKATKQLPSNNQTLFVTH